MRRLTAIVLTLLLGGCGERALPNGYKWTSIYGDTGVIRSPSGSLVIDLKVSSTTLKISQDRIHGLREVEEMIGILPHALLR